MKNKKRKVYTLPLIIGLALIAVSGIKIFTILHDLYATKAMYRGTAEKYVVKKEAAVVVSDLSEVIASGQDNPEATAAINEGENSGGFSTGANSGFEAISSEAMPGQIYWYELATVDIAGLKAINSDICGWLMFENEDISYPILQGKSNDSYIKTTYENKSSSAGSIFLEQANSADFEDDHSIIYGHNMYNLTMFGRLKDYLNVSGYYEENKYFQIFTQDKIYRYEIFAYKQVDPFDDIFMAYTQDGAYVAGLTADALAETGNPSKPYSEDAFVNFISDVICRGNKCAAGMELPEVPKLITLSTCSGKTLRTVISAVRVGEHDI